MTPQGLETYRAVAKGTITAEEAMAESNPQKNAYYFARLKELQSIHNTNKPVIYVDMYKSDEAIMSFEEKIRSFRWRLNLKDNLDEMRKYISSWALVNKLREENMARSLNTQVEQAIEDHPELDSKEKVTVLLTIGSSHTSIIDLFKEIGIEVQESGRINTEPSSYFSEVCAQEKQGQINEETLMRALLEKLFNATLRKKIAGQLESTPTTELSRVIKKVISNFSMDDIGEIFDNCHGDLAVLKSGLDVFLIKKNIRLPQNSQQVSEFLEE